MKNILKNHPLLLLEFTLLCVLLPSFIIVERMAPHMFLFLWGAAIYCIVMWFASPATRELKIWKPAEVNWQNLKPILIRFTICSVLMLGFITLYDPARRFELIGNKTDLWMRVMLFYPVLSALPQEFIFCTFFFARYAPFFTTQRRMIAASAIVFAYAHVLFINPVAPLLSLIAGYFFATTYAKHKSLALVAIEHALYGNMMFTLGLGWYFYGGALR